MHGNLIIGCLTMSVCLAVQCFVLSLLLNVLIRLERKQIIKTGLIRTSLLLIAVMLIMLAGNIIQMTLWAGLFFVLGEFRNFSTAFYHSVVNFSTLGYGDLVMSEKRRLLGALESVNGVLMFGLSTGFLYTVLNSILQREWNTRMEKGEQ